MRFKRGQAYRCADDGQLALVADVKDDGYSGKLIFLGSHTGEWFELNELHQTGKWHLVADPTAAEP
jgi:hypothetical protein